MDNSVLFARVQSHLKFLSDVFEKPYLDLEVCSAIMASATLIAELSFKIIKQERKLSSKKWEDR